MEEEEKLKKLKLKRSILLAFSILYVIGFIFFVIISIIEVCNIKEANRISTKAIIYDITYDYDNISHETITKANIEYEVDGKIYKNKLTYGFFIFPTFRNGREVNIYYNKDNPEECGTYEGVYLFSSIICAIIILNLYINMKIKKMEKQKEVIF